MIFSRLSKYWHNAVTLEQSQSLHLEFVVKDSASICKNICDLVLLKPMQET